GELAGPHVQIDAFQDGWPGCEALAEPADGQRRVRVRGPRAREGRRRGLDALDAQPMSLIPRFSAATTSRIGLNIASVPGILGPESPPSSVSTILSWAGVSFSSGFLRAALNAAGRSPRTVIGSFGIGAERHTTLYFEVSKSPDDEAVASCWLFTSPAST